MPDVMASATAAGRLLQVIREYGSITRAAGTSEAALARSAAGTAVDELAKLGLVGVGAPDTRFKGRGRPSPMLRLHGRSAIAVAVSVHADEILIAPVHLNWHVIYVDRFAVQVNELAPKDAVSAIARAIQQTLAKLRFESVVGIGVSLPGLVDDTRGVAEEVLPLGWHAFAFVEQVRNQIEFDRPIFLGHDATLGALAEFRIGAGSSSQRMLFLRAERVGVGSAMITSVNGHCTSTETLQIGHMSIDVRGPRCSCGARGCLELYVDGEAMRRALEQTHANGLQEIAQSLEAELASRSTGTRLEDLVTALCSSLANIANTLCPEVVVLSGLLAPIAKYRETELNAALRKSVAARTNHASIRASTLSHATLVGAAERVFEYLLQDPVRALSRVTSPNG